MVKWQSGCFVCFQMKLLMSGVIKSKGRVVLTFEDKSLKHQAINSVCFRTNTNPKVMTIFSYSGIINVLFNLNAGDKITFSRHAQGDCQKDVSYQIMCDLACNLIPAMSSVCSLPAG